MDNSSGGDGVVNRQSNPDKYGTVQNRSIRSVNSNNNLMNQSSALNSQKLIQNRSIISNQNAQNQVPQMQSINGSPETQENINIS